MDVYLAGTAEPCDEVFITLNKNTVPNDPEATFEHPACASELISHHLGPGRKEDMPKIAECICGWRPQF